MKTSRIIFLVCLIIFVALLITNPSNEAHKSAVKDKIEQELSKLNDGKIFKKTLISGVVKNLIGDIFLDNIVTRNNYVIFSTTQLATTNKTTTVGFGILGFVYIPDSETIKNHIKEKLENNIMKKIESNL